MDSEHGLGQWYDIVLEKPGLHLIRYFMSFQEVCILSVMSNTEFFRTQTTSGMTCKGDWEGRW